MPQEMRYDSAAAIPPRVEAQARGLLPAGAGILVGSVIALLLNRVGWRPRPT